MLSKSLKNVVICSSVYGEQYFLAMMRHLKLDFFFIIGITNNCIKMIRNKRIIFNAIFL